MKTQTATALLCFVLGTASPALAVEGVVLIDEDVVAAAGGYPFTISAPGSYRLVGSLDVTSAADPPNTTAIVVNTSGAVDIDLNGFSIVGPGTPGTGRGIDFVSGAWGNSIRNGTVRGMGADGIVVIQSNTLIEYVTVVDNGNNGIWAHHLASVRHCRAARNGGAGIVVGSMATVEHSLAQGNGAEGVFAASSTQGAVYKGNIAWQNGTDGFEADEAAVVEGNIARNNSGYGIVTDVGSVISLNVAGYSGLNGVYGLGASAIRHNVSYDNTDHGIGTGSYVTIIGNVMYENGNDGIDTLTATRAAGLNTFSYNDQDADGDKLSGDLSGSFFSDVQANFCEPGTCQVIE